MCGTSHTVQDSRPHPQKCRADSICSFSVKHCVVRLQYSMWLDQHSMEEALKFIRTALEACAPAARGEPGFDDVYPLMQKLCKA